MIHVQRALIGFKARLSVMKHCADKINIDEEIVMNFDEYMYLLMSINTDEKILINKYL